MKFPFFYGEGLLTYSEDLTVECILGEIRSVHGPYIDYYTTCFNIIYPATTISKAALSGRFPSKIVYIFSLTCAVHVQQTNVSWLNIIYKTMPIIKPLIMSFSPTLMSLPVSYVLRCSVPLKKT